jgi:hypothetical protein
MNRDLEDELRQALRPVDPTAEFSERLLATVLAGRGSASRPQRARLRPWAAAAGVVLALGVSWGTYQHQRREKAMQAHAQLLQALAITGRSLDHAYESLQSHDTQRKGSE